MNPFNPLKEFIFIVNLKPTSKTDSALNFKLSKNNKLLIK